MAAYYRKRAHLPALVSFDPGDQEEAASGNSEALVRVHLGMDPAEIVEAQDEWHTVVNAINALTEEQRQVLVGRFTLGVRCGDRGAHDREESQRRQSLAISGAAQPASSAGEARFLRAGILFSNATPGRETMKPLAERLNDRLKQERRRSWSGGEPSGMSASRTRTPASDPEIEELVALAKCWQASPHLQADPDFASQLERDLLARQARLPSAYSSDPLGIVR